ncbi:NUDIX hydrolase [Cytobacillus suaedae]|nr:NUDIX hydrolase [Cytobacillus suaedae]
MNNRPRAFAALIKGDSILMVHVVTGSKDFWTLPGGGLEAGETFEDPVVREVQEEVNLKVKVVKELFTGTYECGIEKCFLVEEVEKESIPTLGYDPELPMDHQELKEVKWRLITNVREDLHVSKVIEALYLKV